MMLTRNHLVIILAMVALLALFMAIFNYRLYSHNGNKVNRTITILFGITTLYDIIMIIIIFNGRSI